MGRRKTRKKPPSVNKKNKAGVIPKSFDCPFCNHEGVVEIKLDQSKRIGSVSCTICDTHWQTVITPLSEAVDVYSEWLDACVNVNKQDEENES